MTICSIESWYSGVEWLSCIIGCSLIAFQISLFEVLLNDEMWRARMRDVIDGFINCTNLYVFNYSVSGTQLYELLYYRCSFTWWHSDYTAGTKEIV